MNKNSLLIAAFAIAVGTAASMVSAQTAMHRSMKMTAGAKMVAYAKAHGMHDKGGDPLTIVPMSSLPKEVKESKAMHGAKI